MFLLIFFTEIEKKNTLASYTCQIIYFINHWDTEMKILTDITLSMLKSYMHIKKINHVTSSELDVFKHFFHRIV